MQFEELSLADCAAHIVDNRGKTCPVGDIGRPLIATNCLRDGSLYPTYVTTRFVSDDTYRTWFRGHPEPGDLIFVTKGSPGRVCLAPNPVDFCIAQDMVSIRADERKVYSKYLFAVLRSDEAQRRIANMHVGTLIPHFKKGDFDKLLLPIPPRPVQEFIGDLYFDLSARIDLLQRTNTTFESIAQALFKSWFVDFDPVHAKQAGREPEGMDAATAALFPAEFEESALGLIPKGWSVLPFAETVDIVGGGTPKTSMPEYWDGDIPWFSVVDAPAAGQVFTVATAKSVTKLGVDNSSTRILPKWTTVISARGTVGKLALTGVEMTMNQSCYGLRPRDTRGEITTYLAAQRLVEDLKRLAHGGVFDTITRDTLNSVLVCNPPPEVIKAFDALTRPLFERILANGLQSRSLAEARDTLLPRLISGKLRLPEAQEQLEDALA